MYKSLRPDIIFQTKYDSSKVDWNMKDKIKLIYECLKIFGGATVPFEFL